MDAASFKQQFLPCHAKLYRVAFRLMGNVQDAEDMVQEAYLKLWKKARRTFRSCQHRGLLRDAYQELVL